MKYKSGDITRSKQSLREALFGDISFFSSFVLLGLFFAYNLINYYFFEPNCGVSKEILCASFFNDMQSLEFLIIMVLFILLFIIHIFTIFIINERLKKGSLTYTNGIITLVYEFAILSLYIVTISFIDYVELTIFIFILILVLILFESMHWSFIKFVLTTVLICFLYLLYLNLGGFIVMILLFTILNLAYIFALGFITRIWRGK
ncbi:MAG: hypothetical protein ACLFPL_03810 [Candidatus Nanoarchaeia archaeon]